jgi:hypothetical protein
MGSKSPEQELEEFLAARPSWQRKLFKLDPGLAEFVWQQSDQWWQDVLGIFAEEYLKLLKRHPDKWNKYCKCCRENALRDLPLPLRGRPPKNSLAQEAIELKRTLSYSKVADRLNEKYGSGTTTEGAVRQLIKSRKTPSYPKT